MDKQYFAFISYKSEDVEWAVWLQHELEHYHLPASFNGRDDIRKDLRPIFRDLDELSAGNLPEQIHEALVNSQNLVVVCSPKAAKSPWVNQEVETFISLGRTNRIYPFIVEGNSPEEFFPPALLKLPKNQERLGGEVSKNGRDAAFVKIVAGMLHVDFDSLWNRYEKEKAEQERLEREKRDNLLRVQSRFISEKAIDLVENGDSYLAQRILLEVMPKDLENPDRPYTPEAEKAFRKALKNPSAILYGHKERVNCAVYSPDGKTILSGGEDNRIHIWDAQTGKEIQKYHEHSDGIDDIVFSPDGKRFVSIASSSLIIWDTESKQKLVVYRDIYPRVYAVAFNPNGKTIAIAQQHNILILDVETGNELFTITGLTGIIHSISYSPDGKHIIADSMEDHLHIWDATTGLLIKEIEGYVNTSVSFSPNGKYIVADTYILEAQTGKELRKLEGHTDSVTHAVFSPDGKRIVTTSWDHTVRVWNVETGEELQKLEGHTDGVTHAAFSPDGKYIVSTSVDKTIRIWQVDSLPVFFSVEKMKMIGTGKRTIFSNDGKKIISISYSDYYDNIIQIWDAKTGFELKRLIGHKRTINSIALSPDGQHIASASSDKSIRIWDIKTGELLSLIQGHNDEVYAVAYSPDGKYLASASSDETIRIWDATTGIEIKRIESEEEYIPSIIFSLDGRFIAAAAFMFIKIWNIDTGEEHKRIDTDNLVKHVAYSPDGQYIVAATDNDILRVWNATTGILVRKMVGHAKGINCVAFSPNGEYIVSASEDSTVRIWNVETGIEILMLDQNSGRVFSAAFSPDGTRIVTAPDEEIHIWDFPAIQDLIDQTREQFKDCPLTEEERRKYYLD